MRSEGVAAGWSIAVTGAASKAFRIVIVAERQSGRVLIVARVGGSIVLAGCQHRMVDVAEGLGPRDAAHRGGQPFMEDWPGRRGCGVRTGPAGVTEPSSVSFAAKLRGREHPDLPAAVRSLRSKTFNADTHATTSSPAFSRWPRAVAREGRSRQHSMLKSSPSSMASTFAQERTVLLP